MITNLAHPGTAQAEAPQGLKCGSFGASSLEDRQLATGDHGGTLSLWLVVGKKRLGWRLILCVCDG